MRLAPISSLICAAVVLAFAAGCDSDPSQVAGVDAGALPANAAKSPTKTKTLKGSLVGTTLGVPADPSVVCPPPPPGGPPSPQAIQMTGEMSHLGLTTLTSTICQAVTGFAFPTVFIRTFNGIFTLEAANGDLLVGATESVGAINLNCSALSTFEGVVTITGGTGRFEGATGTGTFSGTQVPSACPPNFDPPPFTLEFDFGGTIELPR